MPKRRPGPQRPWVFTFNNPTPGEINLLRTTTPGQSDFLVWQLERGDGGTLHVQGYVLWKRKCRQLSCRTALGGRAHCEPRFGTHAQAYEYCTKEETRLEGPFETGEPPVGAGHRSDLDNLRRDLDQAATLLKVSENHFPLFLRYYGNIVRYMDLHTTPRSSFDGAHIYWGVTGSGKSYKAFADNPTAYIIPGGSHVWYDGYAGESTIIFDEFEPKSTTFESILRVCDKYPLRLPVKGGFVHCLATSVYFTSNYDPREWYPDRDFSPMARRSTITHFSVPFTVPGLPS